MVSWERSHFSLVEYGSPVNLSGPIAAASQIDNGPRATFCSRAGSEVRKA